MINATIKMCDKDKLYEVDGYEKIYNIVGRFKEFASTTIHSISENDGDISFNLKGDFDLCFNLERYEYCSVELQYSRTNIDEFRTKYNELTEIIKIEFAM